jgi:hypothetical protein
VSVYNALENAIAEHIWVQALLGELSVSLKEKACLWYENLGATYPSPNLIFMQEQNTLKLTIILPERGLKIN